MRLPFCVCAIVVYNKSEYVHNKLKFRFWRFFAVMKKRIQHADLAGEAGVLLARLLRGDRARVVALSGDLGAGKTTFTQHVARALGVNETVVSPTFVIQTSYDLANQSFDRLVHIDAYRLNSSEELERLGWHELLADSGNLMFIEWPERVKDILPTDSVRITLSHGEGEDERYFDIAGI